MAKAREKGRYTAREIEVLEGLEPVRKRPGMYIGGVDAVGLHHLLWEILDNAVDEAINGFADRVEVVLHEDGETVTVSDNGRGIPTDVHPRYRKPALELILTTLHAGGKFGGRSYYRSGGLHGVGASVVTALSELLVAEVRRDGSRWEQRFARGKATTRLRRLGPARGHGTTITFRADPEIFPVTKFRPDWIRERLRSRAYLHRGLTLVFEDRAQATREEFRRERGLPEYVESLVAEGARVAVADVFSFEREGDVRIECALTWTEEAGEQVLSFVNGIPTPSGGTHEAGLRSGISKALRNYLSVRNAVPKGLSLSAEDTREGLVAVLSVYLRDPQFQGQTKERLNNPEVAARVETAVRTELENFLLGHPSQGQAVARRVLEAARRRAALRAAVEAVQRKSVSHRLNLPGKLADCSSTDPRVSELFIVEGDSAGGSAKQARDREFQAVLPLRGKVLNAEQASLSRVLANRELGDIVSALGCGSGKDFRIEKLRYHRICLLMDADSDGHHICTLLLTFFYRHMPELLRRGHVFLAQPPLYKIEVGSEVHWALDDAEKDRILRACNGRKVTVQRFKGLGEMNPRTLKETTLDPRKRTLLRVVVDDEEDTERTIQTLMGKDVEPRFRFIMERAGKVDDVDV
ncbi:MAG: DNA topoisomerase (ATP-hydrolyzing) [Candidatus Binatia bacterium]|nr:MAG: DNA topoisomerase (ATP-hydrolyzing) [Candidatus Binatia bacterium]